MSASAASLKRLDLARRLIYAALGLAVLLPYFVHWHMRSTPSSSVKSFYDRLDCLKRGSHVLVSADYDLAAQSELNPSTVVLLRHCFRNGLVPIVMTHWNTGVDMTDGLVRQAAADARDRWGKDLQSGRDYVFLGYRPGQSNLVLNMGESIQGAFKTDFYGRPTEGMPALDGVKSLKDITMAVDIASGNPGAEMWLAFGSDRFGFPLGVSATAVHTPDLYPFLKSNQIVGLMGGLRGAADYETLLETPGEATRGMMGQSAAHVMLIVLILGANARMLYRRLAGKSKD